MPGWILRQPISWLARRAARWPRLSSPAGSARDSYWRFVTTSVDARTGEFATFDRDSGVPMVDALAASCAIPGVWPPITLNGHRYMDGTVRSPTNADVAAGSDRVIVLAPMPEIRGLPGAGISEQVAPVRAAGQVVVVTPDAAAQAAMGRDMLSLSRQAVIAEAGVANASALLDEVGELWNG